ncbi:MAG: PDDEXK nuclease domain-containing protein [Bacteriovoracaceae bacterium]|nr:PDDEXK nuclease domain-containing protein [Bacteriovoracaceae bacterium]
MKKNKLSHDSNYLHLLQQIKTEARAAQARSLQRVNHELVQLYWSIGKSLDQRIKEQNWGSAVIGKLAKDLRAEFQGAMGFSKSNLYRMIKFYRIGEENLIFPSLMGKLSWTHISLLLDKFNDLPTHLNFYAQKTVELGWSVRVLEHQIELKLFERSGLTQHNFPAPVLKELGSALKDEYVFDFLALREDFSERELELALLKKINAFLCEIGGVFSFVGNQFKLTVDGDDFFIDILLFHRRLRALVAIELKLGDFKPEYAGKMQFYLSALDEEIKLPDERPSIGIILCKSKKRTIVEYALKTVKHPMAVATYSLMTELPEELKKELPTLEQMETLFKL